MNVAGGGHAARSFSPWFGTRSEALSAGLALGRGRGTWTLCPGRCGPRERSQLRPDSNAQRLRLSWTRRSPSRHTAASGDGGTQCYVQNGRQGQGRRPARAHGQLTQAPPHGLRLGAAPSEGGHPPAQAAKLTWSQLDLQCSPDEGHQCGREVHGHVLAGDGHVHADQALGTRGRSGPCPLGPRHPAPPCSRPRGAGPGFRGDPCGCRGQNRLGRGGFASIHPPAPPRVG